MRLYYEAIEQRVSTVKGPFYISFLCLKITCLKGPESQIRMRTAIIPFDLIGHRAIYRSQKDDTTVKQVPFALCPKRNETWDVYALVSSLRKKLNHKYGSSSEQQTVVWYTL
jgi:hypothetical protein